MPDNATAQPQSTADKNPAAAVGDRLRNARESAGLSLADVTAELHLSEDFVDSLETGDFDAIGAPVFVRGHLRSYARLLKLPEAEITAACPDEMPPAADLVRPMRPDLGPGVSIVNAALLACLVLVVLVALIYWAAGDDDSVEDAAPDATAMHRPAAPPASSARALSARTGDNTPRPGLASDRLA